MSKEELREELTKLNIPFTEKDGVEVLKEKLTQAKMPKITDPSLPYVLFDAEDDEQILQEIQGALLDVFVYSFEQDGKTIYGLSKAGVEHACRESADKKGEVYRIIPNPVTGKDYELMDEPDHIVISVKAGRYKIMLDENGRFAGEVLLDTAVGSKRQGKKFRRRDGSMFTDPFYFEKCLSKAQRNAKMSLLPYKFITEVVKKVRENKGGGVRVLQADRKITDAQIRMVHAKANELGLSHDKITELVKSRWGYEKLNEVPMAQVNELVASMADAKPALPDLPVELIGFANAKGVLKGKRDAVWAWAVATTGGDTAKAIEKFKAKLEVANG